jgi:hypothetical protein
MAAQCRCSQVQVPPHANYFGSDHIGWDEIGLDYPNVLNEIMTSTKYRLKSWIDPMTTTNVVKD